MIFRDPMLTLNPVLRIDTQIVEAIRAHADVSVARARVAQRRCAGGHTLPGGANAGLSAPVFWRHATALPSNRDRAAAWTKAADSDELHCP